MTIKMAREIAALPKSATTDDIVVKINDIISDQNFEKKQLSFSANFDGQILDSVSFAIGETKNLYHALAVKPKYRIILRQEGNGVLTDVPSEWNDKKIQMKNNGAVAVTATIFLVRE